MNRLPKTAEHVMHIREVQKATEVAMDAVVTYICTAGNPTSEEAHAIIDATLLEHDCISPEGHIVAGGIQSAEPHEKGNGPITPGVPIVIDIYPQSKTTGYFADMSRTICSGTPSEELQKMYDAVLEAQELAITMVQPGVPCADIHNAVVHYFKKAGYETSGSGKEFSYAEGFVHSLGHGVGKEIHEAPHISGKSTEVLQEGDVITIEPGLYYKNVGGIRLEDLLYVTADGYENLTTFPKKLKMCVL